MSEAPISRTEQLVRQFYEWEIYGRGWFLWDSAVDLEPPFRRFLGHHIPSGRATDDGRKPTILSRVMDKLSSLLAPAADSGTGNEEEEELIPDPADPDISWTTRRILLPDDIRLDHDHFAEFLLGLNYCWNPLCLELVGSSQVIGMQLAVVTEDVGLVEPRLATHFPDVTFSQADDLLRSQQLNLGDRIKGQKPIKFAGPMPARVSRLISTAIWRPNPLPAGTGRDCCGRHRSNGMACTGGSGSICR